MPGPPPDTGLLPYVEPPDEEARCSLVETTHTDPRWVIACSDLSLHPTNCVPSHVDKPESPCYPQETRYWRFADDAESAYAFPMAWLFYRSETDPVSPDGIFVKSGVSFRLYDGAGDTQPVGPVREGPKYITLQIWQDLYPELIAPGSIIVPGNEGDLRNYSIVLGIEPKIKSIDLRPKTNLSAHHTDLYQVEDASREPAHFRRTRTIDRLGPVDGRFNGCTRVRRSGSTRVSFARRRSDW